MIWILMFAAMTLAQDAEPDPEPDHFDLVEERLSELEAAMDRRAEVLEQFQELIADEDDTGAPELEPVEQPEPKPEVEPEGLEREPAP
jgi:hypothetical protein